jgi:hypothetical protein
MKRYRIIEKERGGACRVKKAEGHESAKNRNAPK